MTDRVLTATVALLAVDPYRLHIYWQMSDPNLSGRAVLRLYDVTERPLNGATAPHGYLELEVDLAAQNWYVDVSEPASAYCAELGRRNGRNKWSALGRSNALAMPRPLPPEPQVPCASPLPDPPLEERAPALIGESSNPLKR
jgi:hypothetical protein